MELRTTIAALFVCVLGGGSALSLAHASSHREAPFITKNPKVDATDFAARAFRCQPVTLVSQFGLELGSEDLDNGLEHAPGRVVAERLVDATIAETSMGVFADEQITWRDEPKGADAVPLAPSRTVTGKLTAAHPKGYFGRFSLLSLGDRPATEDAFLTARGFTRLDLSVGYQHPRFELALALENLLNTQWREAQFANVSRLPDEQGPASCPRGTRASEEDGRFLGCEDIHFTPGAPFAVRASASLLF